MLYKTILEKFKRNWFYFGFLLIILLFTVLTNFNGLFGQDSYEYLRYTESLSQFLKTGTNPGNFFWPLLYPITGSLLSFVYKPALALQLISMLTFIGSALYLKKIIILLYKPCEERVNTFIFLFFLFSPYMLRASMVVMSDMLSIFFLTGAFYYYLKYKSTLDARFFLGFVTFSIASVATRYGAMVLLIAPACIAIVIFCRNFKWKIFLGSVIIGIVIILPHLILRFKEPLAFIHHNWVTGWSPLNFFKRSFNTADGYAKYPVWNIIYSFFNTFHPAFCFIGIVLTIAGFKYFKNHIVIVISVLLYAFFLAGIPFQNLRFLLLSFPLVALLLFPGFKLIADYLTETKKIKHIWLLYLIITIIQLGVFYRVFRPFYHDNKIEKQIAREMLKYPDRPIYTFSIEGALRAYGVRNEIISLYNVRLDTLKPVAGEKMILFNEAEFAEEWKGKNPMTNWEYIKHNFQLTKVEDLPDEWALYKGK